MIQFQNQVNIVPALGKQGMESRQDPIAQGSSYFAENDNDNNAVIAGGFVFKGTKTNQAKPTAEAGTIPLGIAVFPQYQIGLGNNCNINQGEIIRVDFTGCVFAKAFTNIAVEGQHVLVDPITGLLKASNLTSETTYIDTGWIVKTGNSIGQVVEIQKM